MNEDKEDSSCLIILIIVIAALYFLFRNGGGIFYSGSLGSKSWTLFLYKSGSPDTDEEYAIIEGYKSKTECLEEGLNQINTTSGVNSFECGYDCRYRKEYRMEVCDKVCSKRGCRD